MPLSFMLRRLVPLLLAAMPASAESVIAPSGQKLELIEAFWDVASEPPPTLRLRFLAPEIDEERSFAEIEADFLHLCRTEALPRMTPENQDSLIVINMLDRTIPFGTSDPEATQYFEAFRADGGDCVWEGF